MKIYATHWDEPVTAFDDKDDNTQVVERIIWTTSQGEASKAATAKKKELRETEGGDPKTVGYTGVEVDTRKEGLIAFLNLLGSGIGVVAATEKLLG